MSFNLQVKIDTGGTIPEIKGVTTELGKTEKAGLDTTRNLSQAFERLGRIIAVNAREAAKTREAVDSLSASFKMLGDQIRNEALQNASRAFGPLVEQLRREHEMLERIHGPMKTLEQDMQTLDMLQQRGVISAKQYADELARIGKNAGLSRGNPMDVVSLGKAPKAAPSNWEKLNGYMGGGGGLAAGGLGLAALGREAISESDRWDSYANALRKFEKPGHDVSAILQEHIGLSKDLHASMESTMSIYDGVEGAMQELYPTSKQLVDATRELGRIMELDGKSLEQGAAVMETLEYAMSTGTITGRELKGIMKEFPDIADMWSSSLGKSRKEILDLAENGKLDIKKLVMAFAEGSDAIDAKWANRTKTWGDRWREFKDAVGQPINVKIAIQKWHWDGLSNAEKQAVEETEKLNQGFKRLDVTTAQVDENLSKLRAAIDAAQGAYGQWTIGSRVFAKAMLLDPKLFDYDQFTRDRAMEKFDKGIDKWKKSVEEYKAVYDSVKGPQREFTRDVKILDDIFASKKINVDEYRNALDKLIDTFGQSDFNAMLKMAAGGAKPLNPRSLAAEYRDVNADFSQGDSADLPDRQGELDAEMARAERRWRRTSDPILKITGDWKEATAATRAWNAELRANAMQAGVLDQTWAGALNGLNAINESINVAAQSQKILEDGFNGLSDVITDFVTKGEADMRGFVQSMLREMTKLLIFQGLRAIIGGGGIGGSIPFGGSFAGGGVIGPSGTGSSDTRAMMLMTRPDETVHINTPAQEAAYRSGGGGVTVINTSDPRQAALAALNSPEGAALVLNVIHSNISTIRGHVNKR